MSFNAELSISGSRSGATSGFKVQSCHFNFMRPVDQRGMPTGALRDGLIYMDIETSDECISFFSFIDTNETVEGSITFYKADSDQRMKQVKFTQGYLVQYGETMEAIGTSSMKTSITISAMTISIEGNGRMAETSWRWNNE